jgi:hypothetical protein
VAIIIGIAAGLVPYFACWKVKSWFITTTALDTFGVHAIGGTIGAFLQASRHRHSGNANITEAGAAAEPMAHRCRQRRQLVTVWHHTGAAVWHWSSCSQDGDGFATTEDVGSRSGYLEHGEGYHGEPATSSLVTLGLRTAAALPAAPP